MAPPNSVRFRALGILVGVWTCGLLLGACSGPPPASTGRSSEEEPSPRVYHVQLRLTEDKTRAAQTLGRAEQWWREQPPADRPPLAEGPRSSETPVTIAWKAPFYRVRLGPFATETRAEAVLDAARPTFPDAFIAPDRADAPDERR